MSEQENENLPQEFQVSEMEKQLQDTDSVALFMANEVNLAKRNACIFFCIIALALILFFAWNKWLLLIPATLGLGAFLFQWNIAIIRKELNRRNGL